MSSLGLTDTEARRNLADFVAPGLYVDYYLPITKKPEGYREKNKKVISFFHSCTFVL